MAVSPVQLSGLHTARTTEYRALKEVLATVDEQTCPHSYNFHMHTVCSDGRLTPEALMEQAVEIGLKGLAITDHHSTSGYYRARQWMEDWRWRHPSPVFSHVGQHQPRTQLPKLFTGVEITARLLETEVHILGYGFRPDHQTLSSYLQGTAPIGKAADAEQVIASIQSAGGLAVLAHPARYRKPVETLVAEAAHLGIDGIEAYYAYGNPHHWQPCPTQTPRIKQLAQDHQLLTTCGTDTHGPNLLRRL